MPAAFFGARLLRRCAQRGWRPGNFKCFHAKEDMDIHVCVEEPMRTVGAPVGKRRQMPKRAMRFRIMSPKSV